ncbi:MAG TPA: hypothetical protein VMT89_17010 [Candidatus Acidoferrales bacterium]|nr:hypothetical protein [Candidatus Acidoferrales bacterium]
MAHRSLLSTVALLALAVSGCGYFRSTEKLSEDVDLIAVLPLERDEPTAANGTQTPRLEHGAEDVVTAQLYGVLSSSAHWRFVPDLTANDALRKINRKSAMTDRAVQLGKAVKADAVLCGSVSRFVERIGSEYGASQPASVGFRLQLISAKTGAVLWQGEFEKTQEPLTSNLFNAWMFWRAGPRWFNATELAHLGVESLLEQLDRQTNPSSSTWW